MKNFKSAVIAGDGIGPDVIAEGKKVLSGIAGLDGSFNVEFTDFPWGCEYYLREGRMMPEDGLSILKDFDAIYLAPGPATTEPANNNFATLYGVVDGKVYSAVIDMNAYKDFLNRYGQSIFFN